MQVAICRVCFLRVMEGKLLPLREKDRRIATSLFCVVVLFCLFTDEDINFFSFSDKEICLKVMPVTLEN